MDGGVIIFGGTFTADKKIEKQLIRMKRFALIHLLLIICSMMQGFEMQGEQQRVNIFNGRNLKIQVYFC